MALTVRFCAASLLLRAAGCSLLFEGGANTALPEECGRLRPPAVAAAAPPAVLLAIAEQCRVSRSIAAAHRLLPTQDRTAHVYCR